MSIEVFLAVNLASNFMLLLAVARSLGCFEWRRTLIVAGLSAIYAVIAVSRRGTWHALPLQLAMLYAVSAMTTGRLGAFALRAAILLFGATLISGGAARLAAMLPRGPAGAVPSAAIGATMITLMLAARHPFRDGWQVGLALSVNEKTVRFPALIDTGNRLREPISGKPVLIAEAGLLRGAIPESGWRTLPFGGVGGSGELACFHPESVWIERGHRRRRAPDVWVAVTPSPLPGSARALAPCEFASFSR